MISQYIIINLLQVNLPNGDEIRYNVDALNRRVAKMVNGTYEYKLLYSGQLAPVARLDADDRVVEEYIYGTRINVPDYIIKDGSKYRILTDHRGSVRFVVDTHSGEVVQETEYCEFGQIISENLAEDWEPVIFGYAGGLQDRDTGLIRFGARDYDPEVGRWTSKEPLGFNGANNFYIYAENDPVNFVDVSGLAPMTCFQDINDLVSDVVNYTLHKFNDSHLYEYLAEIYHDGVCYYYLEPYTDEMYDNVKLSVQRSALNVLKEKGMVAFWHSHVAHEYWTGSISPSPDDESIANYFGKGFMTYFDSRDSVFGGPNVYPTIEF